MEEPCVSATLQPQVLNIRVSQEQKLISLLETLPSFILKKAPSIMDRFVAEDGSVAVFMLVPVLVSMLTLNVLFGPAFVVFGPAMAIPGIGLFYWLNYKTRVSNTEPNVVNQRKKTLASYAKKFQNSVLKKKTG